MPLLPDKYSLGNRPLPDAQRPIVTADLTAPYKAMEGLGNEMTKFGAKIAKNESDDANEFDGYRAKSYFLKGYTDSLNKYQDSPVGTDPKTLLDSYNEDVGVELKNNALNMVRDPAMKAKISYQIDQKIASGYNSLSTTSRTLFRADGAEKFNDSFNQNLDRAANATTYEEAQAALDDNTNLAFAAAKNRFLTPTQLNTKLLSQKKVTAEAWYARDVEHDPEGVLVALRQRQGLDDKGNATISKPANSNLPSDADSSINYIIDNFEGGYSASDGNTGNPVNFGINQAANKDIDVKNLTKADAAKLYKERYWDKNKIGDLPENMRLIAMDTVINFGKGPAMLTESGNDPQALAQLRIDEHQRLIDADPKKYGGAAKAWAERDKQLADLVGGVGGQRVDGKYAYLNNIPAPDVRQKYNSLQKEVVARKNNAQVADLQNTTDIFSKVSDGSMNLSDVLDDPTLSADQKKQAQVLLLGGPDAIKAAQGLVGTGVIPKGTDVEGINNLDIVGDLEGIKARYTDNPDDKVVGSDKFFAEQMQRYNNVIAKINIGRAVNMNNRGKGISDAQYKTLMKAIKTDTQAMYADKEGSRGGGSLLYGRLMNANTGFQVLTDKVNDLTKDPLQRNELLGYAFTYAEANKIDLFTPGKSTSDVEAKMGDMFGKLQEARSSQLGLSATAPKTQAAIVDGRVENLGSGDPNVKPAAAVTPTSAPSPAPAGIPSGATFAKYIKGKPYYKQPDGKYWTP